MRTDLAVLLVVALCAGCATRDPRPTLQDISLCEPPEGPVARPDWCQWPREVRIFADRYDACQHFRGEEPYDSERRRFLEKSVYQTCTGNDERLRKLRSAYAGDAEMMRVLNEFEMDADPTRP